MSSISIKKLKCPNCNEEFEFGTYDSINVTLNPDLKSDVLNANIFKYKCPNCNEEGPLIYPFLYHDMEKHFMIHLASFSKKELNDALKSMENMMSSLTNDKFNYRHRLVNSVKDLIEKITILDNDLNDKVIEIIKCMVKVNLRDKHDIEHLYFHTKDNNNFLAMISKNKYIGDWQLSNEFYEKIKTLYKDNKDKDDEHNIIDETWAINFLEKLDINE